MSTPTKNEAITLCHRLQTCADFVRHGSRIADIGTDHAYIPIYLALKNKISYALACDLRSGPLEVAQKNILKYSLENIIETKLSDGFKSVDLNKIDDIIIAGMGGETIAQILNHCPEENKKNKRFILQPMTSEYDLRIFLNQNCYKVQKETAVVSSQKVYTVILAEFTGVKEILPDEYFYIGKVLEDRNTHSEKYIKKQLADLNNRLTGAKIQKNTSMIKKYQKTIQTIHKILEG